jgi:hypothetical protein
MSLWEKIVALFTGKKPPVAVEAPKPVEPPKPPPGFPAGEPQRPVNPGYENAKGMLGKNEHDPALNKRHDKAWKRAGYGAATLATAWCMVFIINNRMEVGQGTQGGTAAAKSIAKIEGTVINFMVVGLPEGAELWINHKGICTGKADGNHATYAAADCTPEDLKKPAKKIPALGGNQGNEVNISPYCVKGDCKKRDGSRDLDTICMAKWPPGLPIPPPVTKSKNCNITGERGSTR